MRVWGLLNKFQLNFLFEDRRTRNLVCTIIVLEEYGHKHMVTLFLSYFCLDLLLGYVVAGC